MGRRSGGYSGPCLTAEIPRKVWLPPLSRRPRLVLTTGLAAIAVLAMFATRVRYDHNLLNLQNQDLESVRWERELIDQFTSIRAYQFGVTLRRWMHRLRGWVTAPLRVVSALRARLRRGG